MITPEEVEILVEQNYCISIRSQDYLEQGFVAHSYKLRTRMGTFILKYYPDTYASNHVKSRIDQNMSLLSSLKNTQQFEFIGSVPIKNAQGDLVTYHEENPFIIYPYVPGNVLQFSEIANPRIIEEMARIMGRLHRPDPTNFQHTLEREDFKRDFIPEIKRIFDEILDGKHSHQNLEYPKYFIESNFFSDYLIELKDLSEDLQDVSYHSSFCHRDLIASNIIKSSGDLHIIDWDHLKIAPPEADFVFWLGNNHTTFLHHYGQYNSDYTIDLKILKFFYYERFLHDVYVRLMMIQQEKLNKVQLMECDEFLQMALSEWGPNIKHWIRELVNIYG